MEECDMLECCLCGALCGACCAAAGDSGHDRRRNDPYANGQPAYVQPVMVQQQPGYGPPPGQPGYPQAYAGPQGEYNQYPPQQYPPQQYPPQQYAQPYPPQQQYPPK